MSHILPHQNYPKTPVTGQVPLGASLDAGRALCRIRGEIPVGTEIRVGVYTGHLKLILGVSEKICDWCEWNSVSVTARSCFRRKTFGVTTKIAI